MSDIHGTAYRKAASRFSASMMSNAKWRKLFRALLAAGVTPYAEWRYIDNPQTQWTQFPAEVDLGVAGFKDGRFQPVEYRWIESIFIPSTYCPAAGVGPVKTQNLALVLETLENTGQFPIEHSKSGITIRAYKP